jgi:hypothetical protein
MVFLLVQRHPWMLQYFSNYVYKGNAAIARFGL